MKAINVDKTVETLLKKYGEYIGSLIGKYKQDIARKKYKTKEEKEEDTNRLKEIDESYKFLQEIIKNPKKYLYHDIDMIYVGFDENDNPVNITKYKNHQKDVSVYNKLDGIRQVWYRYHPNSKDVLYNLSEYIAPRIMFDKDAANKRWEYYTGGAVTDQRVEDILNLNQYVALLKANDFVKTFKGLLPASHYAEPLYPKDKRR